MQIAHTSPASSVTTSAPVSPGTVIGRGAIRGWDATASKEIRFHADVVAGPVLRAGVRDIQRAAYELIGRGWVGQPRDHSGLVGFIRNGDAWDAVALLAPQRPGAALHQLWSQSDLESLRVAEGVRLDAIWQISDYGGDTHWRTPLTRIPELR